MTHWERTSWALSGAGGGWQSVGSNRELMTTVVHLAELFCISYSNFQRANYPVLLGAGVAVICQPPSLFSSMCVFCFVFLKSKKPKNQGRLPVSGLTQVECRSVCSLEVTDLYLRTAMGLKTPSQASQRRELRWPLASCLSEINIFMDHSPKIYTNGEKNLIFQA